MLFKITSTGDNTQQSIEPTIETSYLVSAFANNKFG